MKRLHREELMPGEKLYADGVDAYTDELVYKRAQLCIRTVGNQQQPVLELAFAQLPGRPAWQGPRLSGNPPDGYVYAYTTYPTMMMALQPDFHWVVTMEARATTALDVYWWVTIMTDADLVQNAAARQEELPAEFEDDQMDYAVRDGQSPTEPLDVYIHHQIMGAGEGVPVFHVDGNGLNNQRANLQVGRPTRRKGRK